MSAFVRLSTLSSLSFVQLESERNRLILATNDRAALLVHITDFVLVHHIQVSDLKAVHHVQMEIVRDHSSELSRKDIFLPKLAEDLSFDDRLKKSRPEGVSWLTWLAMGGEATGDILADAMSFVFNESKHLEGLKKKGVVLQSFRDRCWSTGVTDLCPPMVVDKSSPNFGTRRESERPRDRIAQLQFKKESKPDADKLRRVRWDFKGVLENEARMRLHLSTVPKGWTTVQSGIRCYGAYMSVMHRHSPHFPAEVTSFGAWCCIFDNPGTLSQYASAVKKAHSLLNVPFLSDGELSILKRGAAKFQAKVTKSFISYQDTSKLCKEIVLRNRPDLARLLAVSYTFQLRTQSEGLPLESLERHKVRSRKDIWHSFVRLCPESAEIVLKTRKNKDTVSAIRRDCQCPNTPECCGVCALRQQTVLARRAGQSRVFWTVKASDIRLVQDVANDLSISRPTWHGFRRGRTTDLVTCVHWNTSVTLLDVFESGGWSVGSRAVLHYLSEFAKDRERLVSVFSAGSESD